MDRKVKANGEAVSYGFRNEPWLTDLEMSHFLEKGRGQGEGFALPTSSAASSCLLLYPSRLTGTSPAHSTGSLAPWSPPALAPVGWSVRAHFKSAQQANGEAAAIFKVAELVGGIGLGTGFRSANRSVAGRASSALW